MQSKTTQNEAVLPRNKELVMYSLCMYNGNKILCMYDSQGDFVTTLKDNLQFKTTIF